MATKTWLMCAALGAALCGTASAAEPIKALIVDGRMNRSHDGKQISAITRQLLEETGLFTVDFATAPPEGQDLSNFRPQFSAYRLVVVNYDGEEWPEETKRDFVAYVRGGGGVLVQHSADNAFPNWPEYNEMIGVGGWGGRTEKHGPYVRWRDGKIVLDHSPGPGGSHGPQHEFQITVRTPEHPIVKGLPPVFMHPADELYNRLRGPAKNLTVLATAYSPKEKKGTGEHEPVLMTIRYGKGRIFHTVLAHGPQQMRSVAFIVTLQRGAEWAATGKVTQKVPADFPGPDQPVLR